MALVPIMRFGGKLMLINGYIFSITTTIIIVIIIVKAKAKEE